MLIRKPMTLQRASRALRGEGERFVAVDAVMDATAQLALVRAGACSPGDFEEEALFPSSTNAERTAESARIANGLAEFLRRGRKISKVQTPLGQQPTQTASLS